MYKLNLLIMPRSKSSNSQVKPNLKKRGYREHGAEVKYVSNDAVHLKDIRDFIDNIELYRPDVRPIFNTNVGFEDSNFQELSFAQLFSFDCDEWNILQLIVFILRTIHILILSVLPLDWTDMSYRTFY